MGKKKKSWYGIYGETILKITEKEDKKYMNLIPFQSVTIGKIIFLDKMTIMMK